MQQIFFLFLVRNGEGKLRRCHLEVVKGQARLPYSFKGFLYSEEPADLQKGLERAVGAGSQQLLSHMSRQLGSFNFERNGEWILKPCWMKDVTAKLVVEALWCSSCCFYCFFQLPIFPFLHFFLKKKYFFLPFLVSFWLSI